MKRARAAATTVLIMLAFGAVWPETATADKYGLVIGLGDNGRDDCPLPYTDSDAKTIHGLLTHPLRGGMDPNKATLLLDEKASPSAIMNALKKFSKTDKDDLVVIYFTGRYMHDGNDWAWMPYQPKGKELQYLVTHKRLKSALEEIPARTVLIVDALVEDWPEPDHASRNLAAPRAHLLAVELWKEKRTVIKAISEDRREMFHPTRKGSRLSCVLADALNGAAEADEHDKTTLRAVGFYVAQKMQRLKIGDRNRPHPMLFMLYSSRKVNTRDGVILPAWQIAGRHATQAERMTELVDALEAIVALATLDMDDKNAAAMLKSSQEVIQRMEASIQEYRKDAARHKQQIEVLRAELQHSRLQVRKLERACRQLMEQKAKLKDAIPRGQEPAVKQPKKNPANPTPARQRSRTGEAKKGRNGSDKGKAQCGTEKFANPIWTVTSVKDNVVAINAGSDAEVKKGMRLVIYRDNQFVGYLKVQQVSDNSAAGVIENAQRNVTVGDSVTAALPMGR